MGHFFNPADHERSGIRSTDLQCDIRQLMIDPASPLKTIWERIPETRNRRVRQNGQDTEDLDTLFELLPESQPLEILCAQNVSIDFQGRTQKMWFDEGATVGNVRSWVLSEYSQISGDVRILIGNRSCDTEGELLYRLLASNGSSMKAKHPTAGVIQLAHGTVAREQGRAGKKGRCSCRYTSVPDHAPPANRQCEFHARNDTSVFSSEVAGRHSNLWTIFASHDADARTLSEDEIAKNYSAGVCKANISLNDATYRHTFELLDSLIA
jgi:hypothetical protein